MPQGCLLVFSSIYLQDFYQKNKKDIEAGSCFHFYKLDKYLKTEDNMHRETDIRNPIPLDKASGLSALEHKIRCQCQVPPIFFSEHSIESRLKPRLVDSP